MTDDARSRAALETAINEALSLLHRGDPVPSTAPPPLPSLYEACLEASEAIRAAGPPPLRTIHHLACTGGTLIARHLDAMPNVRILSELDPLSPLAKLHFSPTDPILQYRMGSRPAVEEDVVEAFRAALSVLLRASDRCGERLILRDHSHSRFCTGPALPDRATVRGLLAETFPLRSIVTVRHPLDSWLSLLAMKWVHFTPGTLNEYAARYDAFLDAHDDLVVLRYEDLIADPEAALRTLCEELALPYSEEAIAIAPSITMTGSSGRRGAKIEARERRPIPPNVRAELADSPRYAELCTRLGYDP